MRINFLQRSSQYNAVMLSKKHLLFILMSLKPREGKHISVRPNSNTPNTSLIFICFHLQLAFHDLYNIFCFVKIELLNSKTKGTILIFVKKAAALAWIHQLLNLFDHK